VTSETLVTLWARPPGTRFSRSPVAEQTERIARIYYAYWTGGANERWGMFTFYGTYAFRFLDEMSGGQSKDAFHELKEVIDSAWARSMQSIVHFEILRPPPLPLRHFRIYFDENGRYDIIAQEWTHSLLAEPPSTGLFRQREAERARALYESVTPCPCCETRTISKPGAFEVCQICGWEDDPSQSANPARAGGANELSLDAARAAWQENPKPLLQK